MISLREFLGAGAVCRLMAATTVGTALMVGSAAAQDAVTLRVASFIPAQGFLNVAVVQPYLEKVEAASNGTLKFDFFPGGTLGRAPAQQLSLVQSGTTDMAVVMPAYTPGAFEDYNVTQLPNTAPTTAAASVGAWEAFDKGLLPQPEGVKVLGIVTTANNVLHTQPPVAQLSDMAGLKIRAAGSIQSAAVAALGGSVIGNIAGPEIAEGMSRNLLDGTLMDWIGIREFRVDRLAENHLEIDFGRLVLMLAINQASFDKLPQAAKDALTSNGGRVYAEAGGKAFDDAVDTYRSEYVAQGHKAVSLSEDETKQVDAALAKVVDDWVAETDGREALLEVYRAGVQSAE
ncbi:TRAP transporter substrate-binding protein [Mesobacterium pallidum]|uniref:TRAP transporter substrate-binding protein n=1 Tax=Mesobacterium pallidum TaxID=2872037 RepID=UPI001EE35469|nr:TRAP transporter substrate-binding protein [Mesobacterium pallidum]